MRYSISDTAEYGDLTRGPRVIDEQRARDDGARSSARSRAASSRASGSSRTRPTGPCSTRCKRQGKEHLIETVGKELRGMMSWIDEGGLDIDV